ncbi:MAG: TetR/AcrR family transcriptional regulator, partial [Gammaproteobacteria bacterium]|nr:TetR/AcrR family transcriptional regulator [Gammaproteobacteria bacterium]
MNSHPDTRQRIVTSARDLIYSRSYAGVGVAEICARAEVRKGSFYHFFTSKQELALAVIEDMGSALEAQVLGPAFARDLPPFARLARFLEALHAFQQGTAEQAGHMLGCPFGNLALELATSDETIRRKLETVFAAIQARFEQVLEEAAANGEIQGLDIPVTAQAMLAYIEGVLLMAKTANDAGLILRLGPA